MSVSPFRKLAPNGRDVSELSREELENFIIELDHELTERTVRITNLKTQLTKANAQTKRSEETVAQANLDYIHPPGPLKADYAKRYAGKEALDFMTERGMKPASGREAHITGAYNPAIAANKRITNLRQKEADIYAEIQKTREETAKLTKEMLRLKAILEQRGVPQTTQFRHKHGSKIKPKKGEPSFKKALLILDQLIKNEKDEFRKDCYKCCHMLLSGHDREALELFSLLYDPELDAEKLKALTDKLNDRNAFAAILREQLAYLSSKQDALGGKYKSLLEKAKGKDGADLDEQIANLKQRLADLDKALEDIPKKKKEIEDLMKEKDALEKEKDALYGDQRDALAKLQKELAEKLAKLNEDRAAFDAERKQLEEEHARLKTRYDTIIAEMQELQKAFAAINDQFQKIQAEKKRMKERLLRLAEVGIKQNQDMKLAFQYAMTESEKDPSIFYPNMNYSDTQIQILQTHPYMPMNVLGKHKQLKATYYKLKKEAEKIKSQNQRLKEDLSRHDAYESRYNAIIQKEQTIGSSTIQSNDSDDSI